MLKNMYWIWVLALLGFMSCADNDNVGKVERVDLLDFDFPQGNDPWDKEIEQIAKDWGMYIIYKDVDSTHLNRRWTTPVETAPIYVCTTPSSDDIQVYLQLVKDWLLSGMDKDNEADREQLPIYLYLVNDFNDGNPKSSSYMKNHIQLKKDGMDYWSLSFTSEELAAGLTPKMIHGVACSFSYPGMKSRFTTGVYKVAPGFLEMTDYETRIGTRYCSKEQFLEENPGIPEVWYDENTGICLYEKDPENVSAEQRLAHIDIDNLLLYGFRTYNIHLPFTYEIMTKQGLLNRVKGGAPKNFYYVELFQQDLVKKGYYLGVSFESVQPVLLENMGWLFLASGFCIFGLMFVFIITIVIIMRQQKLSVIKNDFINNMTHEFKTPIATISLATSAIMKDKVLNDREQILKFNTMIKSENDRMNKYVERILQQAKLDRRELQINKTEVDINEMVREAVEHFMLIVQNAGGTLECKFEADHFIRSVDEVHMMNAVCNLIDNAIKYSGGKPDILVYTQEKTGAYLIGVQDHGIGISKEAQKKVFKRFYRVPSGNLHNVKGFGLGLSYVKSIVELHGGSVKLTSRKNKGTLVEIEFKKE